MDKSESDAVAIGFWMEEANRAREKVISELIRWAERHWEFGDAGLHYGCKVVILSDLITKLEKMGSKK